jgi:phage-related protein
MANEIQLKFGPLNLQSGDITIGKISSKENKDPQLTKIPGIEGSIAEEAKRASLTFSFNFTIVGDNYDDLRINKDILKAAFHNGLQKFTLDDDRYIMAQLLDLEIDEEKLRGIIKGKVSFISHYPFWLSDGELHTDERIPTSGVGYPINNAGNAPTRIKIEITAPAGGIADNCKIENQTTTPAQMIQYRGTIAEYEKLEIDNRVDTDDFEVLNNTADDTANFEGDFMELAPGNNTIVFIGPAGTTVKISYRDAWY